MYKLFLAMAMAFLITMGCTDTSCICPNQDIVISVKDDGYTHFIPIPKGSLDDADNYMTEDQYDKFIEQLKKDGGA